MDIKRTSGKSEFLAKITITHSFPPVFQKDKRKAEVAMVMTSNENKIWLMTKAHYPEGVFRLPTGGINDGEDLDLALRRELIEEASVQTNNFKLIGTIDYHISAENRSVPFKTFIFLIPVGDVVPVTTDLSEKISGWELIGPESLEAIGKKWEEMPATDKKPYYNDWGRFRSVVHYVVGELLNT